MTREADSASRLRTLVFNAEQCDELIGSDAQVRYLLLCQRVLSIPTC